ncbi:Transcriptional regulatory protein LiaR [Pseudomonas extremaustralis]|nr:LuxR C-terminal-related transcriptional regulator [Pseudomonas extremaustralis]MDY7065889.1 Transcriptional regulatory protein LiaR [Pseudomonas extremaustralis]
MDCTTLLLIDDHPLFRKGLAQLFDASDDFEVVGQAASGREGINLAVSLTPQQVLLDLHMPGLSGLQVLDELRQLRLDCQVVVLTASMDRAELLTLAPGRQRLRAQGNRTRRAAGVYAQLPQGRDRAGLDADRLARRPGRAHATGRGPGGDHLTEREGQTLALIAAGMSNKQIGRELGISDGTVKIYVRSLLQKLGLHSRLELAAWVHSGALLKHEERH